DLLIPLYITLLKIITLQRHGIVLVTRVIKKVCDEAGIKEEELRKGGRRRKVSHARARISYQLSHGLGIPAAEIARHLGVCTSAIARAIQKLES
ncbi:MAG: hypothetical protein ACFFCW_45220, partial [Candidatus Hodarchaeota archaeon]